jgi:hypothetical protein
MNAMGRSLYPCQTASGVVKIATANRSERMSDCQVRGGCPPYDRVIDALTTLRKENARLLKLLCEASVVLDRYWFTSADGESYNNDDVIDMSRKIDAEIMRNAEPPQE